MYFMFNECIKIYLLRVVDIPHSLAKLVSQNGNFDSLCSAALATNSKSKRVPRRSDSETLLESYSPHSMVEDLSYDIF